MKKIKRNRQSKLIYPERLFFWIILMLIFTLGINFSKTNSFNQNDPVRMDQLIVHTVQPGETLWDIASLNQTKDSDIRDNISEIIELNNLSSCDIQSGDKLLILCEYRP